MATWGLNNEISAKKGTIENRNGGGDGGHIVAAEAGYYRPGNIRELQHTIEKAVILCEGSVIRPKDILVKQTWQPQTNG